jgi:HlyD family secretion protein
MADTSRDRQVPRAPRTRRPADEVSDLLRVGVAFAVVALLSGCGGGDGEGLQASGTVEATDARLGFQSAGRVEKITVREGDTVVAGQELATLDRSEAEARRDQATAQVAAARARLAEMEQGFRSEEIARARAEERLAAQRLADAERELERSDVLLEGGAISQEAHDKAVLARDVATAQLDMAREQLGLMQTGYRSEQIEAARAQLAQAEAVLAGAESQLRNMTIFAPFPGVVTIRHREPGESVAMGSPVLTLMNPDDRWVRIYVREDRIGAVGLGGRATLRCDTFPDRTYQGEVTFIASQAEFTPKSVQTTEERVKLVYAVKVGLRTDSAHDLKPGMPADVALDAGS